MTQEIITRKLYFSSFHTLYKIGLIKDYSKGYTILILIVVGEIISEFSKNEAEIISVGNKFGDEQKYILEKIFWQAKKGTISSFLNSFDPVTTFDPVLSCHYFYYLSD